MIFALVGNQNSGKTTLFNQLTGSNQHVGNFPGVTVEHKTGKMRKLKDVSVVDLPGIYSIRPYSIEETVTRDFLIKEKIDGIINIIDATNIERNLYLTLQLIELRLPVVIALNMMDEIRNNGSSIDINTLSDVLGVPVVAVSAAKNEGIEELIEQIYILGKTRARPKMTDFCRGAVHRCIHSICHIIEDHAERSGINSRFSTTKIIEGDDYIVDMLELSENEKELIEHDIIQMEEECGLDRNAALADMRYNYIENICKTTVTKKSGSSKEHIRSLKIDSVLTNRVIAIPLFVTILLSVFWLTFEVIGAFLSDLLSQGLDFLTSIVSDALIDFGINSVVCSLIIDGVFTGVGSVLSFLPLIVTLFFFLSLLEDSGYMARVAFIMDKPLRKIGLSGRSFVPMLIGFGCSVPAIMATRTLSSVRDRRMTILLTPFMSCTAKIPIYAVFTAAFFSEHQAIVMILLYMIGIITGIVVATIMNKTSLRGKPVPFVMELPNYRMPSAKTTLLLMWDKAKDFLQRAFTIIFLATIIIWFLQNFDVRLNLVENNSDSLLASLGRLVSPVFAPLGFDDWRISTALVTGLTAKEAVVSTLSVLVSTDIQENAAVLSELFTAKSAFSFLIFTLLYTPCFAAIAAIRRELGSGLQTVIVVLLQCVIAWLAAALIGRPEALALFILALCVFMAASHIKEKMKKKCENCSGSCTNCK